MQAACAKAVPSAAHSWHCSTSSGQPSPGGRIAPLDAPRPVPRHLERALALLPSRCSSEDGGEVNARSRERYATPRPSEGTAAICPNPAVPEHRTHRPRPAPRGGRGEGPRPSPRGAVGAGGRERGAGLGPKLRGPRGLAATSANFGTPLARFVSRGKLHGRPQWANPHAPTLAHLFHVSWPTGNSTEGPNGKALARPPRHSGPPSFMRGKARMHPPQRFGAPSLVDEPRAKGQTSYGKESGARHRNREANQAAHGNQRTTAFKS